MVKYFKVTNKDELHHGFQYNDGLNVLKEKFNDNLYKECVAGGLYFSDSEKIPNFYNYGIYIREVFLPENDPDFKMVKLNDKYRANKIILGKRYSLEDPDTFKKLDLQMDYGIIDNASRDGNINILQKWKDSGVELVYSDAAINWASRNNHINVLDWWKNSGLELKYSYKAMDAASIKNHINVLEWWVASGLELKYSENAIDTASMNNHINILEWWVASGLSFKYSHYAMIYASSNNHINVLEWWSSFKLL